MVKIENLNKWIKAGLLSLMVSNSGAVENNFENFMDSLGANSKKTGLRPKKQKRSVPVVLKQTKTGNDQTSQYQTESESSTLDFSNVFGDVDLGVQKNQSRKLFQGNDTNTDIQTQPVPSLDSAFLIDDINEIIKRNVNQTYVIDDDHFDHILRNSEKESLSPGYDDTLKEIGKQCIITGPEKNYCLVNLFNVSQFANAYSNFLTEFINSESSFNTYVNQKLISGQNQDFYSMVNRHKCNKLDNALTKILDYGFSLHGQRQIKKIQKYRAVRAINGTEYTKMHNAGFFELRDGRGQNLYDKISKSIVKKAAKAFSKLAIKSNESQLYNNLKGELIDYGIGIMSKNADYECTQK